MTVNWPSFAASPASESLSPIETVAVSSSAMFTKAVSALVSIDSSESPPAMAVSVTMMFSRSSRMLSSTLATSIVVVLWPAKIVAIPERGTKSVPALAEPATS